MNQIGYMADIAAALGDAAEASSREAPEASALNAAQGAGLRALRHLLLGIDKEQKFGGMRRVLTESGDWRWVCPEHYPIYDAGLPKLPYT
ncbi:MAG: hypothetical protein QF449_15030 [Alphaproteobacteria bacterium]|nr:hypothetical protein [Alphaproteobacteria bacterium]MDP6819336.1 hypothetical protein [Alphaproteobacteria bacterium]